MKCRVQCLMALLSSARIKTPRTPKHFSRVVNRKALTYIAEQICGIAGVAMRRAEPPAHW